ncbi:DHA2 family efflux MFS transporter permease subunit [Methanobacterium paludis]|uniref:Drug resistance transporter, EmrB/QacA subfamily n=1 Tax=Methanobacterium paludis (strain DSM 25820 / JCM 18151 / SWAN1) TaxID=868131 RepID=F6D499_METPW|nr:drug resistance transporter, EmrB/QacA subfamily [Methanobacterium paludis]
MVSTQNENYTINKSKPNKSTTYRILTILLIGGFLSMLNETALNIAFPHIMLQYNISAGTVQWLTTIYVLVSGIVFLISAFLIQRFSTRKLFISSMIFLIIGTTISGISTNFPVLFIGRVIQAIGTGILVPLIFNTVLILIPQEKRGLVMGLVTLVVLSAPMFAPVLMGFLMGFMDWHWFFLMVLVFFVATIILGLSSLRNVTEITHPKLDILSVILAAVGFSGIITGFSGLGEYGLSLNVIIPLFIGLVSLILFTIRQLTLEHPLLDLHVFKYPFFTIGIIINVINVMVVFAVVIILPIYLQTAIGTTSLIASLVMLPGSIFNCFLPLLAGHIYDKHGTRIVISSGLALMCISMIFLSHLSASTALMIVLIMNCGLYVGSALLMSPNQTNALGNLDSKYYASGSAIMTSLQQIGGAIGSSLFVSFMTFSQNNYLQNLINPTATQQVSALVSGVDFAFLIGAVVLGLVFVLSLFLKRETPT